MSCDSCLKCLISVKGLLSKCWVTKHIFSLKCKNEHLDKYEYNKIEPVIKCSAEKTIYLIPLQTEKGISFTFTVLSLHSVKLCGNWSLMCSPSNILFFIFCILHSISLVVGQCRGYFAFFFKHEGLLCVRIRKGMRESMCTVCDIWLLCATGSNRSLTGMRSHRSHCQCRSKSSVSMSLAHENKPNFLFSESCKTVRWMSP